MEADASVLEMVLTWVMLGALIGGGVGAALWARRRRRQGKEASDYNAEGAEALIEWPT